MKIVVSGVNMVEGGILSVLRDTLEALKPLKDEYQLSVTVLVHRKVLVSEYTGDFEIIEFPDIKTSWSKRVKFEYSTSKKLAKAIQPDLWISLHDMTPNVYCPVQVVYCHNPSPFYKLDVKRFFYDVKFSLFCLFYKYLYGINIKRNNYVIVQQDWIRSFFKRTYGVNSIVAYPKTKATATTPTPLPQGLSAQFEHGFMFFYPTFPRIFKNVEVICEAAGILAKTGADFEVVVTMNGTENTYSRKLKEKYGHIEQIKFIGLQSREVVQALYSRANCLVMASKLETWGLPVSEFVPFNKPIIAADLPYAHETAGNYNKLKFFEPDNAIQLANFMQQAINGILQFDKNEVTVPAQPFFTSWTDLLRFLIEDTKTKIA